MVLTIGVLGPIEARRGGVLVGIPAGKTRELLARLALDAGRRVRVDVLLDDLWGGERTARNTLQSKVSQLRRAIGPDLVVGSNDGYQLAVTPEAVDALRAEASGRACALAQADGDAARVLEAARTGLGLFRGEVLAEAGDWAAPHRTRLAGLHADLLEQAMAARVDLGAGGEIVAELESLLERHSLREGLWAALIVALYRAGRQAESLAAYQRARRLLRDELGVEPGPQLRAVEAQVLRHSVATSTAVVSAPGNLPPSDPTPMVGRAADVVELSTQLGGRQLVTILGAGGVGKTRLGLEVAHRLDPPPGGVWLIRFDGVDPDTDLTGVLADALQVSGGAPGLRDRVSGAATLLVLDNCEHLIQPLARLLRTLLDAAPRLRVLATSQAPLGLIEEHRHQLRPLSQEDAVALFTQRAAEARGRLVLDQATTSAIADTCRSLDGLPLAIELAAARARALSIADIARRLDDRFALLADPSNAVPDRHNALVAAVGWSYDLLRPDDQRVLGALACFAGGAGLAALEAVAPALDVPETVVGDVVSRLVDRSLITAEAAEGDLLRYRLMDTIRLYALGRLERDGLVPAVRAAHAAWCAATADWCNAHIRTERQPTCLRIVRAERANIDAALAWCRDHDRRLAAGIAAGFAWSWVVLGDGTSAAARLRSAASAESTPRERALLGLSAAWLEASAGNVAVAEADLEQVAVLPAAMEDPVLGADLDRHRAFLAIQQGRADLARWAARDAKIIYDAQGLAWQGAACLLLGAYGSIMAGDTSQARTDAEAALVVLRPIGDSWGVVHGEAMLGAVAQAERRFEDAALALERAIAAADALGFVGQAALHRASLARVRHRAGDPRADGAYTQALQAADACGDGRLAATVRVNLARLRRSEGDREAAIGLLETNQRWYAAAGGGDFALLTRCLLASARDDESELAIIHRAADEGGEPDVAVLALDGLARLAAQANDPTRAQSLLVQADAAASHLAHSLDPGDRYDRQLTLASAAISSRTAGGA